MIVVTAPTGNIGSKVVENLLAGGHQVRVIARDPSRLSASVRDRVEVVTGSHRDADVVNEAFAGADVVFWLPPADPTAPTLQATYVDFARPAVDALVKHQVPRVVGITGLGRTTPYADQAGYVTASLEMDDLIAASGVAFRALTMPSFFENLLNQVQPIKARGAFSTLIAGDRKLPLVATRDIAAVATRYLVDDSWTSFEEVPVLGPENISPDDEAAILADAIGAPVAYQQGDPDSVKNRLTGFGMSEAMAQGAVDMGLAKDNGLDLGATDPDRASSTPTTFRQWVQEVFKPAFDAA